MQDLNDFGKGNNNHPYERSMPFFFIIKMQNLNTGLSFIGVKMQNIRIWFGGG